LRNKNSYFSKTTSALIQGTLSPLQSRINIKFIRTVRLRSKTTITFEALLQILEVEHESWTWKKTLNGPKTILTKNDNDEVGSNPGPDSQKSLKPPSFRLQKASSEILKPIRNNELFFYQRSFWTTLKLDFLIIYLSC
jgi:hypothetical protein